MKSVFSGVGAIVVGVLLLLGCVYGYLELYKDVAPKFQEAKREVFENTPSYVQGKAQVLTKLRMEYTDAESDAQKATIKEMILTEAVTVDREKLPSSLQGFLRDLESGELNR